MEPAVHNAFKSIVLDGAYAQNGMASFDDLLNEEEVEAIHQYLVSKQIDLYEKQMLQSK